MGRGPSSDGSVPHPCCARTGHPALAGKGAFPVEEFRSFAEPLWEYVKLTKDDSFVDRQMAGILHGLALELDGCDREVPGDIRYEAERLDVLFFSGYDPYFEGDEPPGL
jgi:hypothetical protein